MNTSKFFIVDKRGFEDSHDNRRKLAAIADYFVDNGAVAYEGVCCVASKYAYEEYDDISGSEFFGVGRTTKGTHHGDIEDFYNNIILNLDEAYNYVTNPEIRTLGIGSRVKTPFGKGAIIAEGVDKGDEVWVIQLEGKVTKLDKIANKSAIRLWTEFDDIYEALQNSYLVNGILTRAFCENLYEAGFLKKPE